MPNQVVAGVAPVCFAHYDAAIVRDFSASASNSVPCLGVTIGFAREFGRHFDLRLRLTYQKPFPDSDVLFDGLHEFKATLAPEFVGYTLADAFTVTLGPEVGLYVASLSADATRNDSALSELGAGYTVAMTAGLRPWVTYHTGFFAEVSSGIARLDTDGFALRTGWLGRITVGWADRF
jgi:hypothetical protein